MNRRPLPSTYTIQPGVIASFRRIQCGSRVRRPRSWPSVAPSTGATSVEGVAPGAVGSDVPGPVLVADAREALVQQRTVRAEAPVVITVAPAVISSSPTAAPVTAPVPSVSRRSTRRPSAMSMPSSVAARRRASTRPCPPPLARCERGRDSSPPTISSSWNATPSDTSQSTVAPLSSAKRRTSPGTTCHWLSGHVLPVEPLGVVVDAGRRLQRRAGAHDDTTGEAGGPADLTLGLGDQHAPRPPGGR